MFRVFVLIFMVVWYGLFRYRRRRMYECSSTIPGAMELPLLGHLHYFAGDTEHIMKSLRAFSKEAIKRGGIVKLWLGHLLYFVMVDPVDIEYVLKNCLEKDDLHRFFREVIGNGVVFAPVDIWRVRRKNIVPAFSPRIVDNFVEVFSEQSQILAQELEKRVGSGPFDVWPFMSAYTLDSVSETVMGTKIEAQTTKNAPLIHSLGVILNVTCERVFHTWQQIDLLFKISPRFKEYNTELKYMYNFTDDVVTSKRQELAKAETLSSGTDAGLNHGMEALKRKTFLDLIIENSNKSKGYNDLELREEVLTLTVAGTDTSAVAMSFTLLLLGKYQDIQDKVYQELVDVYGNSDRPLVKEDLSKLVYLDRVVKESMRLYPPVPFIIRKIEKEVKLPSGKILPAGSGVAISIWGTHRNTNYWGEDADEFDPDRFSPERYNLKHPCAYMPFSQGPRNCLGYQYAMMSLKTSLSTILRKYRVMVSGENLTSKHIRVKIDIMMKAVDGYDIVLQPRKTTNQA